MLDHFLNKMFLVAIDAYLKWPEVDFHRCLSGQNGGRTTTYFATRGLRQQLVSNNGPQFVSEQFAKFLKQNGIKHFRSAPCHPVINGLVEQFIQILKRAMKGVKSEGNLPQQLSKFLLIYRKPPHATTKQ